MGCGCGGSTYTPPGQTVASTDTATKGVPERPATPTGPAAPGYTWNGPAPREA